MKPGSITAVLVTWQQARFVAQALDSILAQTRPPDEILVVDDGSRDGTWEILQRRAAAHPEIRLVTHAGHRHEGLVATYQRAFAEARGDLVAFLEGDDVWRAQNLEKKAAELTRFPEAGVVYAAYEPFGEKSGCLYWSLHQWLNQGMTASGRPVDIFRDLIRRNPVASFSHFMIRRSLLPAVPELRSMPGNFDWWVLAHAARQTPFVFLREKLSAWRIHSESAAYGRLDARRLWKLRRFLSNLHDSLLTAGVSKKQDRWLRALRQELGAVQRARSWFGWNSFGRRPVKTLRLAGHVGLRNFLCAGERL